MCSRWLKTDKNSDYVFESYNRCKIIVILIHTVNGLFRNRSYSHPLKCTKVACNNRCFDSAAHFFSKETFVDFNCRLCECSTNVLEIGSVGEHLYKSAFEGESDEVSVTMHLRKCTEERKTSTVA